MNSDIRSKIKELKPLGEGINVDFRIIEQISEKIIRNDNKISIYNVADESAFIQLQLWNEDASKVELGNNYRITNGRVKVFNNIPQLSTGRDGTIEPTNVTFDKLNTNKNISTSKKIPKKIKPKILRKKSKSDKKTPKKDNFSYKVDKKHLWAELR